MDQTPAKLDGKSRLWDLNNWVRARHEDQPPPSRDHSPINAREIVTTWAI